MRAISKKPMDTYPVSNINPEGAPEVVVLNKETENLLLSSAKYGHHRGGIENSGKLFTLLASADPHGDERRFERFIDYLNYYPHFDAGICLGDIAPICYADEDGDWYKDIAMGSNKELHTVLGNHDLGNSADRLKAATVMEGFEKFIKPLEVKTGMGSLTRPYYMRLYDEHKTALIILNSYDNPSDTDKDGNYRISRGCETFGDRQIEWLIDALMTIPVGYHLIMAMHTLPYELDVTESSFTQRGKKAPCPGTASYGNDYMIADIVNAWVTGERLERDYAPRLHTDVLPTISVKCDFTKRGKGEFAFYLLGHKHVDIIASVPKYPSQTAIFLGSLACDLWQNGECDLPRTLGTHSEDLMTAISLDTEERTVRIVRIGSDVTVDLTERKYAILNY